jgi:hypothetical protein
MGWRVTIYEISAFRFQTLQIFIFFPCYIYLSLEFRIFSYGDYIKALSFRTGKWYCPFFQGPHCLHLGPPYTHSLASRLACTVEDWKAKLRCVVRPAGQPFGLLACRKPVSPSVLPAGRSEGQTVCVVRPAGQSFGLLACRKPVSPSVLPAGP